MTPQRHMSHDDPPARTKWESVKHWFHRWWPWLVVVIVAAFLVGRSQLQGEELAHNGAQLKSTVHRVAVLTKQNRALVNSLQAAVVDSCVENGNAARRVTRETLTEEIHDAKHPDPVVLKAFDIPPAKLQELIDENVKKLQIRRARVRPINCAKQYQISPGSGVRRQDRLDSSTP